MGSDYSGQHIKVKELLRACCLGVLTLQYSIAQYSIAQDSIAFWYSIVSEFSIV